ncbi:MAG TPA: DUF4214 domain-containing protein [Bryobacteraceae bacterium]|nr:DUF4214 domain-containing protein [Bryobacteraceae bacterium]
MRKSTAAGRLSTPGLLLISLAFSALGQAAGTAHLAGANRDYGKLPLTFEENRGQTDARVRYISRGSGYTLFLTPEEALLQLTALDAKRAASTTSVRMRFVGAAAADIHASGPVNTRSTYFIGQNPQTWLESVQHFNTVHYKGMYKGVDALFYGNQRELEYDFVVAPGADPRQIRLKFDGVSSMSVAPGGDLVLHSALGELRQLRPVVYQTVNGQRKLIAGRYRVNGTEASFELGQYDRKLPLVIDPVLAWSTYLGGSSTETLTGVAVNAARETVVTGFTASADFPAAQRFIGVARGGASDAFVTKYSTAGNTVVWSAFIGGVGADQAMSIALDVDGAIYVSGLTDSANFPLAPTTAGTRPIQDTIGGAQDAFMLKLNPEGSALVYSTFFGGFGNDVANEIRVDANKQAAVAGTTASTNLNARGGPFAVSSGGSDAWAAKIAENGQGIVWSTYLGGSNADFGNSVAVDSTGAVYVTGSTMSIGFPRTTGVVQPTIRSVNFADAFVTKISATGALVYSTYLGGAVYDDGVSIAVDANLNAVIFGNTESADFPTAAPSQAANAGGRDTFVAKLNPTASALVFSTFLGGTGVESAGEVSLFENRPHVIGSTASTNFPVANAYQTANAGAADSFVTEMSEAGALRSSTYFGGAGDDIGLALALDGAGNIYFGGITNSFNLPVLNQVQTTLNNVQDGFVAKLSNCAVTLAPLRDGTPGAGFSSAAATGAITITASADCAWVAQVQPGVNWIALSGTTSGAGPGTVTFTIAPNTAGPRTAYINVAGVRFNIEQQGGPVQGGGCVYPLQPSFYIAPAGGVAGTVSISTNGPCVWTASSNVKWLHVLPLSGTASTEAGFTVFPNFGTQPRIGAITVTNGAFTQTFTVTQASSALTRQQRYITLLYQNFLGRYPQQHEIDFYTNLLGSTHTELDLATSFFNTPEFNLGGRLIAAAYVTLLNRLPDFSGWQFNRNALVTGLVNQTQLVSNFVNSPEFQQRWGTLSNEAFVTLLYQQVLSRTPQPSEVTFHASRLNAGLDTRGNVATVFLSSPEFVARANQQRQLTAYLLHATYLQRDASAGEMLSRETQLADPNVPLQTIIQQFITSPEFNTQLQ